MGAAPEIVKFQPPDQRNDGTTVEVSVKPVAGAKQYKVWVSAYPDGKGAKSMAVVDAPADGAAPTLLVRWLKPSQKFYFYATYIDADGKESKPSKVRETVLKDEFPMKWRRAKGMNIESMKLKAAAEGGVRVVLAGVAAWACVSGAAAAWFGGGPRDGHADAATTLRLGYPQVNNADGATNVLDTSAFLNGALLASGGAPAELRVYWGTADGGTTPASWGFSTNFGVRGTGPATVRVAVEPKTTYHYRFYAENGAGESGWAPSSATFTSFGPPLIEAGAAVYPLGRTTATLHGRLTEIDTADVTLYWGADPGGWSYTNALGARRQGDLSARIANLTPGRTYFYQWRAANAFGTSLSSTPSFRPVPDTAWFGGGARDGYDVEFILDTTMTYDGTVIVIR